MNIRSRPALRQWSVRGSFLTLILLTACGPASDPQTEATDIALPCSNPLATDCGATQAVPAFDRIVPDHFPPAMRTAIERSNVLIASITDNPAPPDFANTIGAFEKASAEVTRIARIWFGLAAVDSGFRDGASADLLGDLLTAHERRILTDEALFRRIDRLHAALPGSGATAQQRRLIEETWRRFRRAGAHLEEDQRQELDAIDRRIAALDREYEQLRQAATHRHELLIEDPDRLDGLPASLIELAHRTARDRGYASGWVFTLHAHSFYPFMRHFPGREERHRLYRAWMTRYRDVLRSDEDLGRLIDRLARLRARRAAVLGFESHVDYLLDDASLPGRQALTGLLDRMAGAARIRAEGEHARLMALAAEDGVEGRLQPWDWWYYRQRLHEAEGSDKRLAEWLGLEAVEAAMFGLAGRLWGLQFRLREDLPAWHPKVRAYQVLDRSGTALGILYLDPIHRFGKRGGAWTSRYRVQHTQAGRRVAPVVAMVTNLPPAGPDSPTLLSPEQVRTLFHEFGHALHSLLSNVEHASLAGTNVPPDFVEFPALLLERWALAPEVLRDHARHFRSDAALDPARIRQLQRQAGLTSGLETLELLAAIELDLALHGARAGQVPDLESAERDVRERLRLPAMISPRHHGGGLASVFASHRHGGDFRTLWAELLAGDAFAAFRDRGILNRELAGRLREEILAQGNARPPMVSWQAFRGRAPDARFLLEDRHLQPPRRDDRAAGRNEAGATD